VATALAKVKGASGSRVGDSIFDAGRGCLDVLVLPELASTRRNPRSFTSASSSWAPSKGWISPMSWSNSSPHAPRRSSPGASSTSRPPTVGTNITPPIPMPRWMRHIRR